MDVAKSLFGARDHEGYAGKEEHMVRRDSRVEGDFTFLFLFLEKGRICEFGGRW